MNLHRHLMVLIVAAAYAAVAYAEPDLQAGAAAAPDGAVDAVWAEHNVDFYFLGDTLQQTVFYECESIRNKLEQLLRLAGARRDLYVRTSGCYDNGGRFSSFVSADLHFHSPTVSRPAESVKTDEQPLPAAARWTPVKLQLGWTRGFDSGDCTLVDQFRRQVLKYFDVRNLTSDLTCSVHLPSPRGRANLDFETLIATHAAEEESIQQQQRPKKHDNELKSERK